MRELQKCDSLFLSSKTAEMAWEWGYVFSNVLTRMITVDVVCYKYKPLKNGELPIKIKVCKDRCTWLKKYELWLRRQGLAENTIGIRFRTFRRI
jgi:hypothetical protein